MRRPRALCAGRPRRPRTARGGGRSDGGEPGQPDGGVYEWYRRGLQLIAARNPEAAATLLERAAAPSRDRAASWRRSPGPGTTRAGTAPRFKQLIVANPTDDYAQFRLGLAARRNCELELAAEHLALAAAMRPDLTHYQRALRAIRARRGPAEEHP